MTSLERLILEINQDDDSFLLSFISRGLTKSTTFRQTLDALGIDDVTLCPCLLDDICCIHLAKAHRITILTEGSAVGCPPVVSELVTDKFHLDLCTIGQRHRLPTALLGWNGVHC